MVCARIIICAVVVFWAPSVVECAVFATPSWMHTVSRNLEGQSLTAKSAEEFKKKQLAAAAAERKVIPLAATGAAAMTAAALAVGERLYRLEKRFSSNKYWLRPLIIGAGMLASGPAYAANIPGSLKRKKMHELHAKHADVLYALLQDPEFKKKMGVVSWEYVHRRNKKAEAIGLSVQTIGSVLALFAMVQLMHQSEVHVRNKGYFSLNTHPCVIATTSGAVLLPLLIGLGAKPLITRLMGKKGGAEQLNKEFAKAIAAVEARKKHKDDGFTEVDASLAQKVST